MTKKEWMIWRRKIDENAVVLTIINNNVDFWVTQNFHKYHVSSVAKEASIAEYRQYGDHMYGPRKWRENRYPSHPYQRHSTTTSVPRYKKRVMLSSLLAMKLELKICFQNQVSGSSESEAARSNQKEKRQMYRGFARLFSTSSSRKKAKVSVMDTLILGVFGAQTGALFWGHDSRVWFGRLGSGLGVPNSNPIVSR